MKENLEKIFRKNILSLSPYKSARAEFENSSEGTFHLLDANESPYPPFDSKKKYNLYPEPQSKKLKEIASQIYKVSSDQIMMTRGSDEAIDILIRAVCEPREDSILTFSPTFGMYEFYANIQNVGIRDIPLDKNNSFQLNLPEIYQIQNQKIKLIFLPNPVAPLGHLINERDIIKLCKIFENRAMIVIDEAYIEFSNSKSFIKKIPEIPNLVVLRTFSKAYSMAGLRIGFCIASSEIISILKNILSPYPLSTASTDFAIDFLSEKGFDSTKKNIKIIIQERQKLAIELKKLAFVEKVFPSYTNFLFLKVKDALSLLEWCKEFNFILRSFHSKMENTIRVSISRPNINIALINLLKNYEKSYPKK